MDDPPGLEEWRAKDPSLKPHRVQVLYYSPTMMALKTDYLDGSSEITVHNSNRPSDHLTGLHQGSSGRFPTPTPENGHIEHFYTPQGDA